MPFARLAACALFLLIAAPAAAQDAPMPSQCLAMAETLPKVTFASFTPTQAEVQEVTITYAGHSTYVIETPGGVRIATDYSGRYGADPLPDVVTMNKAHSTHYSLNPDPRIAHVLPGWNDENPPAAHALVVDDVYIRNVPTDIRAWSGMEVGGNSIFVFEVAGLCIGHLGHLHHQLEPEHYAAIGRLDVVMVPIDGGMTLSLPAMSEIARRLQSSIVLPMHRFSTPIAQFVAMLDERFAVEFRDSPSTKISTRSLPRRPTVVILEGV
ncbi:MAG: MBL fold metallo-hydrolase [Mesorhizobium sp.]|nr:MBL fold metallo-hydrolase [Mesorhizobium sp.]